MARDTIPVLSAALLALVMGVSTGAAQAPVEGAVDETEPVADPAAEPETGAEPEAESEAESETEAETESETEAEAEPEAEAEAETESVAESAAETVAETESSAETEPGSGGGPEAGDAGGAPAGPSRFVLERVEVRGNGRTDSGIIRAYVPLRDGEALDARDPRLEAVRWRLLSTGWFESVRVSIERGSERPLVVLVVQVQERNTFVVQNLAFGVSEGLLASDDPNTQVEPYFGLSLAEGNLFGTGVGLELATLLSLPQQGVRLRAGRAGVGGSDWGLTGSLFFNNGREFFGNDDVVVALDECPDDPSMPCEMSRNAVVVYRRYGGSIGTGVDLGTTLRLGIEWHFEAVELVDRPEAASHRRGSEIVPIDFHVHDGLSFVSALMLGLEHDERDQPGLPTSGRHVFLNADLSARLIGSSYDFVRVQGGWREWFRLPEAKHTLRLGAYAGAAVGDTPFFYRFYVADLSDLIPSRMLELNLDRRAPPNLLGTSVAEMRAQELAGRIDVEYSLWVWENEGDVRGLVIYGLVGAYTLLDGEDLRVAIPGYEGFSRAPIDLTFDVGVRLDTVVGVFEVGFSTLLGFVQL